MANREYYELVVYNQVSTAKLRILDDYLSAALLPAYERRGIGPVGVFRPVYGGLSASTFVLVPHPDGSSALESRERLFADPAFLERAASFLRAPIADPAYVRMESSIMRAFAEIPRLELPDDRDDGRLFELRIYESHCMTAHRKKIAMFNEGGEIGIFRRVGLRPMMFGATLFGARMPNLAYILAFRDMAHRDAAWEDFKADPQWVKLRDDPQYADTVSSITDLILRPTPYSGI